MGLTLIKSGVAHNSIGYTLFYSALLFFVFLSQQNPCFISVYFIVDNDLLEIKVVDRNLSKISEQMILSKDKYIAQMLRCMHALSGDVT